MPSHFYAVPLGTDKSVSYDKKYYPSHSDRSEES